MTETPEQRAARHAEILAELRQDLIYGYPDPWDADVVRADGPRHIFERLEQDRPGSPCRAAGCGLPKTNPVHI